MIRNYTQQTLDGYRKRFPLLSSSELIEEIKLYEEIFIASGTLKPESGDHHKYIKGWLMRANLEKIRAK